jgi:HSP90 family molecular chaperone
MVSLAFRNTTDEVFWEQFGRTLKEGVGADYDNKDTLISLLLFPSSHDAAQLTTLQAYVDRMQPDQTEIFYITGESRHTVEHSPHLEAFKAKHYEVLFLLERVARAKATPHYGTQPDASHPGQNAGAIRSRPGVSRAG